MCIILKALRKVLKLNWFHLIKIFLFFPLLLSIAKVFSIVKSHLGVHQFDSLVFRSTPLSACVLVRVK